MNELLNSGEKRAAHAATVEATVEGLHPFCTKLRVPAEPSVAGTPMLWQLTTEVTGQLRKCATSSLELATPLHPAPPEPTRTALAEAEPLNWGYYSGMVGWSDSTGNGEWALAHGCGEIEEGTLRLYASANLAVSSEPVRELARTSAKLCTALAALGWHGAE